MDTQASIVKFVDSNIDQIIEWASIDPETVLEEFQAAGYQRSGGGPIEEIAHLKDARLRDADTIARRFRKSTRKWRPAKDLSPASADGSRCQHQFPPMLLPTLDGLREQQVQSGSATDSSIEPKAPTQSSSWQ
jgi:hypothetical protein